MNGKNDGGDSPQRELLAELAEERTVGSTIDRRSILALAGVGAGSVLAGCLTETDRQRLLGEADGAPDGAGGANGDEDRTNDETGLSSDAEEADGDDADANAEEADGERGGHALPFEDDFDDLESPHESSTLGNLGRDTSNAGQFARPAAADEETDSSRLNRVSGSDAQVVYRFSEAISGIRTETHYHPDGGEEISVAVSADGEAWTDVDGDRTLYNEAHNDEDESGVWWENYEFTAEDVGEDAYYLRITLAGDLNWSPQLGRVAVW